VVELDGGKTATIGIERLHLEQDAGKLLHDQSPTMSYVDLNRCGVALMEIVSEPDLRSADEAGAYLAKLRSILRYLGTCDGDMEKGHMRCDANVTVRKPGGPLNTRVEIKNVNSIRFLRQAIEYEARRQIEAIEDGKTIVQETRLFDAGKGVTRSMRTKEHAHDYRYFPDPDLLPLVLQPEEVDAIRATLPELPDAKKARFIADYKLSPYDANVLAGERETADYYEAVVGNGGKPRDAKAAANWVTGDLFGALGAAGKGIEDSPVGPDALGQLLDLLADNTISGRIAKDVFKIMVETGAAPADIVKEKGLVQVTDTGAIEAAIDQVLAAESGKVAEYRSGKDKLFGFFVGQVMKATGGKANPKAVNDILKKKLAG
jgi:aspartyl-tRNA(Asn)/glutamyl-tRNA(Gln) amidotransferase subunit B